MPFDPQGGNVMIEVESTPATSKKRKISPWPSIVLLFLVAGVWVFLFHDFLMPLFVIGIALFLAICLICCLVLLILRKLKRSFSFLISVVMVAGWLFILAIAPAARTAFADAVSYSRNYVDFVIYAAKHHIKADVRQNGYKYKRWHLRTDLWDDYYIVFDGTDGIVKKDGTRLYDDPMADPGCSVRVFSVGNHFYLVKEGCPAE